MRDIARRWNGIRRNGIRRGMGVVVVAAATLVPVAVGAAGPVASATHAAYAKHAKHAAKPAIMPPGTIVNATVPLGSLFSRAGDMIASGWDISMPGSHPAATVVLSGITATIPLLCLTATSHTVESFVIDLPDTSISISANDSGWTPTSSSSNVTGYQRSGAVPQLCENGLIVPRGNVAYAAKLASADTTSVFAMRFHAVDGHRFTLVHDGGRSDSDDRHRPRAQRETTNTDCSSATQNTGVAECNAVWTAATENTAAASLTTGRGTGGGSPGGPGSGSAPGSGSGRAGSTPVRLPVIVAPASVAAPARPPAVKASTMAPIPVLVLPEPSSPTVLGPVPLMIPVIASGGSPVGAALPWNWFLLLAIIDLALIVGIVLRRRRSRADWPSAD